MFKKEQETQYRLRVKGLQHFSDPEPNGGGEPEPTPTGGNEPQFSQDDFWNLYNSNNDIQKDVRSKLIDSEISKAIDSYKKNTEPKNIQKAIDELNSETPEMKRIKELEGLFAAKEQEAEQAKIEAGLATHFNKYAAELEELEEIKTQDIVAFCLKGTFEESMKTAERFVDIIEKISDKKSQRKVDERFATNYSKPADMALPKTNATGNVSSLELIQKQLSRQ